MRKLIVPAFISLDGVVQAPGGPQEDPCGSFAHDGWIWPHADGSDDVMGGVFERPFELLLGRRTWDSFAAYWPNVPQDALHRGLADRFNGSLKHVATHHPDTLAWQNSRAPVTQGSSELVHQLLATNLVDELRLLVYPILLGRGKRLFDGRGQATASRLDPSKASPTGVLSNRYVRVGEVRTGSFE